MRKLKLQLSLVAWTMVIYCVLWGLGLNDLEPVRYTAPQQPIGRPHGLVVPNPFGLAVWLVVVACYGAGCGLLGRLIARYPKERSATLALLVTLGASTYLAVVHPLVLAVYLPSRAWEMYSQAATALVPVLDRIYYHFGLPDLLIQVLGGQILLTGGLAALAGWQWAKPRAATQ